MRGVAATLVLAVVLAAVVDAQQMPRGEQPAHSPTITLRIYDYAQLPAALLARARKIVGSVYGEIGVSIHWAATVEDPDALGQPKLIVEPGELAVKILDARMADRLQNPHNILGLATTTPKQSGHIAYVLFDRVSAAAAEADRDVMDVMGLVMAHEVGHLLLPYGAHSITGLMRADWDTTDLRLDQGQLRFNRTQGEAIRQLLSRPTAASAPASAAVTFASSR